MKFRAIGINGMDDSVATSTVDAKNEKEAYQILEGCSPSFESWLVFGEKRWKNLKKGIKRIS